MKFFGVRPWTDEDIQRMREKAAAEGAEIARQKAEFDLLVQPCEPDEDSQAGQPS